MTGVFMKADTQGVGELLEHRRLFRVPDHQRDFAWNDEDEVEQFIDDVTRACLEGSQEYFLGLVVLVSPKQNDVWEILDGQQRLATTTMMYAAIRVDSATKNETTSADTCEPTSFTVTGGACGWPGRTLAC